jgi:hypothetical protein
MAANNVSYSPRIVRAASFPKGRRIKRFEIAVLRINVCKFSATDEAGFADPMLIAVPPQREL